MPINKVLRFCTSKWSPRSCLTRDVLVNLSDGAFDDFWILDLTLSRNSSWLAVNQHLHEATCDEPIAAGNRPSATQRRQKSETNLRPRSRVHLTGGNRSGSGLDRYQTGPNSKFKFKFKKMKNSQKIPKNTSRCDESNGVKFSQKFVHLV